MWIDFNNESEDCEHCYFDVISGSVSVPRSLVGVGGLSVLCCFLGAECQNLPRVCRFWRLSFLLVSSLGRTAE